LLQGGRTQFPNGPASFNQVLVGLLEHSLQLLFLVNERGRETMSQRLQLQPDPSETLKQSVMQFLRDASAFSDRSIILDLSFLCARSSRIQFPGSLLNPRLKQVVAFCKSSWALIFSAMDVFNAEFFRRS